MGRGTRARLFFWIASFCVALTFGGQFVISASWGDWDRAITNLFVLPFGIAIFGGLAFLLGLVFRTTPSSSEDADILTMREPERVPEGASLDAPQTANKRGPETDSVNPFEAARKYVSQKRPATLLVLGVVGGAVLGVFIVITLSGTRSSAETGESYLQCKSILQTGGQPFRIALDQRAGTFYISTDGAEGMGGKAEFQSEEIWIEFEEENGFIIDRQNLSLKKIGGPIVGQCEKAAAPEQAI